MQHASAPTGASATHMKFAPTRLLVAQQSMNASHVAIMRTLIDQIFKMLDGKGTDYNNLTTFIENMPFGDQSWGTLVWIKAHRVASLVFKSAVLKNGPSYDSINDVLIDLLVYTLAWLAWRTLMCSDDMAGYDPETEGTGAE